jgi:hypothetical protein
LIKITSHVEISISDLRELRGEPQSAGERRKVAGNGRETKKEKAEV